MVACTDGVGTKIELGIRTNKIKGLGIDVESINYDINFRDIPTITCKDFVFDDVTFKDCVVNYNCEKSYPVGKMKSELTLILKGDDKEHNGDCNPIKSSVI